MKISIIGTGYVGLIAGLGFADFGNSVVCLDINHEKVLALQEGRCPIYEPGSETLLKRNLSSGRIIFTTDAAMAIAHGEVIFLALGTPEASDGTADLTFLYNAAHEIGIHMHSRKLIVDKSTVPVGTSRTVYQIIQNELSKRNVDIPFDVASNPEFLREGKAVRDFMDPDRIVLGVNSKWAEQKLYQIYQVFSRSHKPVILTTPETAEMIKYASNAFLATKITFINEIANLCEQVGADVRQVAAAMGKDGRISPKFLHAGPGYGGSCFPKDTKAIATTGREANAPLTLIESVIAANQRQKELAASKIIQKMPQGGSIAVLGLSFKPETDDVRESPAIAIIEQLSKYSGFSFRLYDPQAMENAKSALTRLGADTCVWCGSALEAIENADAIALITEWSEFRSLNLEQAAALMNGNLFFDFRNVYDPRDASNAGLIYWGTGIGQISQGGV